MPPVICSKCELPAIEGCQNLQDPPAGGSILQWRGDDLVSAPCPNMQGPALKRRLTKIDPQLLLVKRVHSSPLFSKEGLDRTTDNLLIESVPWRTFLSHFKLLVAHKDTFFFPKILSDMTLINVYLGKASVQSRLPDQRTSEDLVVSNSIEDLVSIPDLVILRLGMLVHYNRAAAGVLREALTVRESLGKPTWLVEPENQSFTPWKRNDYGSSGMVSCDEDTAQLVKANFERVTLEHEGEAPRPAFTQDQGEVSLAGEAIPELEEPEQPREQPRKRPPSTPPPARRGSIQESDVDKLLSGNKSEPKKKRW